MLQKEVTVSEMWVTCMLHNWCLGVCPQYGSWFSLPILAGAPCCSPCFPPYPSLPSSPGLPTPLKSYYKHLLWVGTAWPLPLPFYSSGRCCVCIHGSKCVHLPWTGLRIPFKVDGLTLHLMLPVTEFSAFLAHLYNPLLLVGPIPESSCATLYPGPGLGAL